MGSQKKESADHRPEFRRGSGSGFIKSFIGGSLSPTTIGRLEYFLRPSLRSSWGGAMNGQVGRQAVCRDIFKVISPAAVVETGTFRGTTTSFLAQFGVPVYSVELQPRFHAFACLNLRSLLGRVHLSQGDSRAFLRQIAADKACPRRAVFFYLDAHWNDDLPLADEIATIFGTWTQSVIMIDDFAVPGDCYGYDDYGPAKALNRDYLDSLGRTDMSIFYPALPASSETGARRGCVILCNDPMTRDCLANIESLRKG